jgi:hypothetical protein
MILNSHFVFHNAFSYLIIMYSDLIYIKQNIQKIPVIIVISEKPRKQ